MLNFIDLVSLGLDIRLNTLTFKFFTISGTQIFALFFKYFFSLNICGCL